jgi:hypothetical protein
MTENMKSSRSLNSKCINCNKKSLMMFPCKCPKEVCLKCLAPENHACTFNYKESWSEQLKNNNPKVDSEKVSKI